MDELLLSGLLSLRARCVEVRARVIGIPSVPVLEFQRRESLAWIDRISAGVLGLIAQRVSPPNPLLLPEHIRLYRELQTALRNFESLLTAFMRFDPDQDMRLTLLCRKLVAQVCAPATSPPPFVVSTMTASDYESSPPMGLVRVPAAEDSSLLGLPVLLHEIGHWIFFRYFDDFDRFANATLDPYFADLATQVPAGVTAASQAESMGLLSEQWRRPWLRELVSDLFAAWVIGAPYALQHVQVCFSRPVNPFADQGSLHPADVARFAAIRSLLLRCGPSGAAELATAEPRWNAYVAHLAAAGIVPGADYATRYPVVLIDALAEVAEEVFGLIGVRRFDGPACADPDLPGLLRQAWVAFTSDLAGYEQWERAALASLWPKLGPPP